jgi:hypothetical protein
VVAEGSDYFRALTFRAHLAASRTSLAAIAVAVFGMFLPVVVVPYAYSDDYPLLWMAVSGRPDAWFGKSIVDVASAGGRPVGGVLLQLAFSAAGTIDNLRYVRLIGIVGVVALALLLHWSLVRSRIKPVPAALIAVFVCSMPVFEVVTSWAVLFAAPYAALLAAGSSLLAVSALDSPRQVTIDRLVGATAMLVAGLLIYQPAAMFFWVFLAVALVGAAREQARPLRLIRTHTVVAAIGLVAAFIVGKLAAHVAHDTAPNTDRGSLTHDLVGKAGWFFAHPLYRSLSLFELRSTPWTATLAVALGAAGIVLWFVRGGARPVLSGLTALILVPLSLLPNLAVAENNSYVFRTGIALTSLIALYVGLGVLGLFRLLRDRLGHVVGGRTLAIGRRAALGVAVAAVAATAAVAARNVTTLVADPQNTELGIIRSDVAALPTGVQRVGFVQIAWAQGMTNWYSDEIGLASSARPWTPQPVVSLILREEGRLAAAPPTVDTFSWDATSYPTGETVIDVRPELQRHRG